MGTRRTAPLHSCCLRRRSFHAVAFVSAALAPGLAGAAGTPWAQRIPFERQVVNLEVASSALTPAPSPLTGSAASESSWQGQIARRFPQDDLEKTDHFISFSVTYRDGHAFLARWDQDLDGSDSDDAPAEIYSYPGLDGARSILIPIPPTPSSPPNSIPQTVRVVFERQDDPGAAPHHRVQLVYGMTGKVMVDGREHWALLYDGNSDGRFSKDYLDGIFVDLDDDRHFEVDLSSPEFGPIRTPFQLGRTRFEAVGIAPDGRELVLKPLSTTEPLQQAHAGEPIPPLDAENLIGGRLDLKRLGGKTLVLFFWATWCPSCERQAPELERLREQYGRQGLEVVGVSLDTSRRDAESFHLTYGRRWNDAFTGLAMWEQPFARSLGVRAASTFFIVDAEGNLDGRYPNVDAVRSRLADLLGEGGGAASR